ncbi:hypothetical protein LC612_25125 [Nostoc sp. CHAB 5834]|nr:hypothetical protein [Nostoc sp. CHAB 5834]
MKTIRLLKYFLLPISSLLLLTTILSLTVRAQSQRAFTGGSTSGYVDRSGINILLGFNPDKSCSVLMSDLSNFLLYPNNQVTIRHLTNYQTVNNSFGGYTAARLSKDIYGNFIGSDNRLLSTRTLTLDAPTFDPNYPSFGGGRSQPFDVQQPDPISYKIDPVRRNIIFNGQYGPYNMTCLDDKFAIVNTGDSIETFTFFKSTGPK